MEQRVKQIRTVQVGLGLIGGTVVEQIVENRGRWRDKGIDVGVAAIVTTGGALVSDGDGFSDDQLRAIVARRHDGGSVADIGKELGVMRVASADFRLDQLGITHPLVMDAAAGSETAPVAEAALAAGGAVVYSNKAPLSQPLTQARTLWDGAESGWVRYETTCGAGLPVISTIKSLLATGDQVIEIVGCLSGTLGAIFSDIAAGKPLSQAIAAAKAAGYTEPDPRDDLSGLDVARKALILARTIGREVDLTDIAVESLVPESLADCSVSTFLERIADHDTVMAERQSKAAAGGATLKYVAMVPADGPISVGVEAVPTSTVLGALQGPENIISIRTARYDRYPLTISGPGAGAGVTAAGMIADMLELARAEQG
jgi:homoserine dehydrogenase